MQRFVDIAYIDENYTSRCRLLSDVSKLPSRRNVAKPRVQQEAADPPPLPLKPSHIVASGSRSLLRPLLIHRCSYGLTKKICTPASLLSVLKRLRARPVDHILSVQ